MFSVMVKKRSDGVWCHIPLDVMLHAVVAKAYMNEKKTAVRPETGILSKARYMNTTERAVINDADIIENK